MLSLVVTVASVVAVVVRLYSLMTSLPVSVEVVLPVTVSVVLTVRLWFVSLTVTAARELVVVVRV